MTKNLAIVIIFVATLSIIHSAPQPNSITNINTNAGSEIVNPMASEEPTVQSPNDLEFPPGFDATSINNREEMYVLAWTMCDNYRKVAIALKKKLASPVAIHDYNQMGQSNIQIRRQQIRFLRFQLANNPMEPTYHRTCLELFRHYPNMRKQIQERVVPSISYD